MEIAKLGERLVVFEGGSGAGKTTAINGVKAEIANDPSWRSWREPGGTEFGELMRQAVQERHDLEIAPVAAMLAYSAARANVVSVEVIPWLEQGGKAMLDRFWYSTYAYQGGGEGLDKEMIVMISAAVTRGLEPGLVVYYDLMPELAAVRKIGKTDLDRYDIKELDFHRRVRDSYLEMAAKQSNWQIIDASQPADVVLAETLAILTGRGLL